MNSQILYHALLFIIAAIAVNTSYPQAIAVPDTIMRQEEQDSSIKRVPIDSSFFNRLKFIRLNKKRTFYMTAGGELRYQYERFENENWGEAAEKNRYGYLLQRIMLYADIQYKNHLRLFAQLKSGVVYNKKKPLGPLDRNDLDIHEFYLEATAYQKGDKKILLRFGRQELLYGSGRLISLADGPNMRKSFQGGLLKFKATSYSADAFVVRPIVNRPFFFDDRADTNALLWGAYVQKLFKSKMAIDVYYIGVSRKKAVFERGMADQTRHTTGARFWSNNSRKFNYNIEAIYQFGKFGNNPISAYYLSSELSYAFSELQWKPSIGLSSNVISGDDVKSRVMKTFDALYPKPFLGLSVPIGPSNLMDVHPSLAVHPYTGMRAAIEAGGIWRNSRTDALYNPGMKIFRTGKGHTKKFVGMQYIAELDYQINQGCLFQFSYTFFPPGPFINEASEGKVLSFILTRFSIKF